MGFWSNFTGGFADKPKPCPKVMDPVDGSMWCESDLLLSADGQGELITPPEAERRRAGRRSAVPVISVADPSNAYGGGVLATRRPPTPGAMRTALHGPLPTAGQLVRTAGPPPAISAASRGGDGLAARLRDLVPGYGSTDAATNSEGRAANEEMRRKHLLIIVATALITYLIARRSQ